MDVTRKYDVILTVIVVMFCVFYRVTLVMVIPHTLEKQYIFRHRMNSYRTACRDRTSTEKFFNHVFSYIKKIKHVDKEPYLKVYAFLIDSNENKLLYYES